MHMNTSSVLDEYKVSSDIHSIEIEWSWSEYDIFFIDAEHSYKCGCRKCGRKLKYHGKVKT